MQYFDLNPDEIAESKWIKKEKIREFINNEKLITPWFRFII